MSTIEIHNDPLPGKKCSQMSQSREISDAIKKLENGQCFYLAYSKQTYSILSTQASYNKRGTTKNFSLRKLHKDGEDIVGLWRTA